MNEKMQKLEALVKDEKKVAEIFTGTPEEIINKLRANGIELTKEEFDAIYAGMHEEASDDSLSEEDLDSVAGGCNGCYNFFKKIGKAIGHIFHDLCG